MWKNCEGDTAITNLENQAGGKVVKTRKAFRPSKCSTSSKGIKQQQPRADRALSCDAGQSRYKPSLLPPCYMTLRKLLHLSGPVSSATFSPCRVGSRWGDGGRYVGEGC